MNKSYIVVGLTGIILGGIIGYMAGKYEPNNLLRITTEIQSQLNTISDNVSSSRLIANQAGNNNDSAVQNNPSTREMESVFRQVVSEFVKTELRYELANILIESNVVPHDSLNNQRKDTDSYTEDVSNENAAFAEKVFEEAIGNGVWDQKSAHAYNEALHEMTSDAQFEAMRKLSVAINNEDVKIDKGVRIF